MVSAETILTVPTVAPLKLFLRHRYIFIEQLWQPMPVMIWMAAIVEAGIGNFPDMAILLFIQFANASIGFYEITKAGDAVAALKASLQVTQNATRGAILL